MPKITPASARSASATIPSLTRRCVASSSGLTMRAASSGFDAIPPAQAFVLPRGQQGREGHGRPMKETEVLRAATEYTFDGTHQALRPFRGNFRTCAQLTPVIRQGLNVGDLVVGVGLVELFKPLAAQCRICGRPGNDRHQRLDGTVRSGIVGFSLMVQTSGRGKPKVLVRGRCASAPRLGSRCWRCPSGCATSFSVTSMAVVFR